MNAASPKPAALPWMALAATLAAVATGCHSELNTVYGERTGVGTDSVNGTAVLAELLERAGHRVTSRRSISPSFKHADVIIWIPDDFEAPSPEATQWLERWLSDKPNRTLLYIGRDFDAAPAYWEQILAAEPGSRASEIQAELKRTRRDFRSERGGLTGRTDSDWFKIDKRAATRKVTTLQGPFAEGVDPRVVEIVLNSRIVPQPVPPYETLLASEGDLIVGRRELPTSTGGPSQLVVVANGSFLLNVPLVNHEHRKLAGKLIALLPRSEQRVIFLESDRGGVAIQNEEDVGGPPSALAMVGVWPLSVIVAHLVVLGIVAAVARWPIFGKPRHLPPVVRSAFGKHVAAVGALMAKTKDPEYARRAIGRFHQTLDDPSTTGPPN